LRYLPAILLERVAKFVARQGGKIMVYYDKIGRKGDKNLESYFHGLCNDGHPFSNEAASKYAPLSADLLYIDTRSSR
jgi:hypothetical protein